MELRSALRSEYLVEAVSPVDTHHTHHREEDAQTYAGRALHIERVELAGFGPSVTAFDESEAVDSGVAEQERVLVATASRVMRV